MLSLALDKQPILFVLFENLFSFEGNMTVTNKAVQSDKKGRISMPTYLPPPHRWGQKHQSFLIRCSYHIDTDTKSVSMKENFNTLHFTEVLPWNFPINSTATWKKRKWFRMLHKNYGSYYRFKNFYSSMLAQSLHKCKGQQSKQDSEQKMMQHSYAYSSMPRIGATFWAEQM